MNAFFHASTSEKSRYTNKAASPRKVDFYLNESQCDVSFTVHVQKKTCSYPFNFARILHDPGDLGVRLLHKPSPVV